MPVVALFLGVGLLREPFTIGAVAGLILIGLGAWLATSRQPSSTSGDQETAHGAWTETTQLTAAPGPSRPCRTTG